MQALYDGLVSTVFSKNVHSDFFFCILAKLAASVMFHEHIQHILSSETGAPGVLFFLHLPHPMVTVLPGFFSPFISQLRYQLFLPCWSVRNFSPFELATNAYIRNIAYDCFSFLVSCLSIPNRCFIFIILIHTKYLANACQLYKHLKSLIVLCLWNWWYDKGPCWTKAACYWSPENVSLPHTDFLTSSNQTNAIKALLN